MRHAPFVIGPVERDAWERAMRASVLEADLPLDIESRMLDYFSTAATHMINSPVPGRIALRVEPAARHEPDGPT